MLQDALSRLARAWPVIAVVDGLFATALSILVYDSTATLLWQGVASTLVVVPALTGRPPTIGARWWVQLAGHVVFVALPIVVMTARGGPAPRAAARPAVTAA